MCVTAYCVHSQGKGFPVIINAVSDAVKRHPNLVEVTVGWGCFGPPALGVVKGLLQKEDSRKVDVVGSWYIILGVLSKSTDVLSCECECLCVLWCQ